MVENNYSANTIRPQKIIRRERELQDGDLNAFDLAVALEYDGAGTSSERSALDAPRVLIKGTKQEAAWLIKTARQFGVPVVEDSGAATALSALPLDEPIPEDLYRAVATILNCIS